MSFLIYLLVRQLLTDHTLKKITQDVLGRLSVIKSDHYNYMQNWLDIFKIRSDNVQWQTVIFHHCSAVPSSCKLATSWSFFIMLTNLQWHKIQCCYCHNGQTLLICECDIQERCMKKKTNFLHLFTTYCGIQKEVV